IAFSNSGLISEITFSSLVRLLITFLKKKLFFNPNNSRIRVFITMVICSKLIISEGCAAESSSFSWLDIPTFTKFQYHAHFSGFENPCHCSFVNIPSRFPLNRYFSNMFFLSFSSKSSGYQFLGTKDFKESYGFLIKWINTELGK